MEHAYAWLDAFVAEGQDFRGIAASEEARREFLPATEALGVRMRPATERLDRALRAPMVPVAAGPARQDVFGRGERSVLLVNPLAPPTVWVALSPRMPAALWVPVRGEAQMRGLLDRYFRAEPQRPRATVRLSVGLVPDWFDLEERLLDHNPFCEAFGSDAPLAEDRGTAQHRVVVRTLHSRSEIELAAYGALVIATVRYSPADDADAIASGNEATGSTLPLDLPVDVAATLFEHPVHAAGTVRDGLRDPDAPTALRIMGLIALELMGGEITREELDELARSADPELRRAATTVAKRRGW